MLYLNCSLFFIQGRCENSKRNCSRSCNLPCDRQRVSALLSYAYYTLVSVTHTSSWDETSLHGAINPCFTSFYWKWVLYLILIPCYSSSGSLGHSSFMIFNKMLKPPWTSPQLGRLWTGDNATSCCEHWWEHVRKSSVQVVFTQETLNQCYWCKFLANND